MMVGIILIIVSLLISFTPGIWVGAFFFVVEFGTFYIKAQRSTRKEADKIALSKPGFQEFYKLFCKGDYWPYNMVTGKKYDEFLSILGRKNSK